MTAQTDKIRALIGKNLGKKPEELAADTTFDSLGADSLDRAEIMLEIENEFDVDIDQDISDKWTTIGEVETHIANNT